MSDCELSWYNTFYDNKSKMIIEDDLFNKLLNTLKNQTNQP
jgi:hypothetical protein